MKDSERVDAILKYLGINALKFANALGYDRGDKIYHILNGRNRISQQVARDIVLRYPQISKDWLLYGRGKMLSESVLDPSVSDEVLNLRAKVSLQEEKIKSLDRLLQSKVDEIASLKLVIELLQKKIT